MSPINIHIECDLDPDEFLDILSRSGLGERRPVDDRARIEAMCANANLIIAAREGAELVGICRCVTDFAYFCYCSDLAVDRCMQGRGIGTRMLKLAKASIHPSAKLYLVSAPGAISYYKHIGMTHIEQCYAMLPPN